MTTPLPARNILDGSLLETPSGPYTSTMKAALGALRDYLAGLLGTTGAAADALTALSPTLAGIAASAQPAWTDYSGTSTIVGFASFATKNIYYKDIGKTRFVAFDLYGVSNSTATYFTLPTACSNTIAINAPIAASDNGAEVAAGYATMAANALTVNCYKSTGASWTASGTKRVSGQFTYQLP